MGLGDAVEWRNSASENEIRQYDRLTLISLSHFEALRVMNAGWTVEMIAKAKVKDLHNFSYDDEISKIWIINAKRLLAQGR